jgi:hypothetical protein
MAQMLLSSWRGGFSSLISSGFKFLITNAMLGLDALINQDLKMSAVDCRARGWLEGGLRRGCETVTDCHKAAGIPGSG